MAEYRNGSHMVYDIKYHFVWITKYRYKVLKGAIALRLRELLKQGCEAKGLKILKGSIGSEHVHMLLSCPTNLSPSQIAQYLKGRSSHLLQEYWKRIKKRSTSHRKCSERSDIWKVCAPCFGRAFFRAISTPQIL